MNSGYYSHAPTSRLSRYVDHFWILHDLPAPAKQMIVPDGGVELILNCGEPQRLHDRFDTSRFNVHKNCWVSGLRYEPIVIGTPRPMSIIGVRFKLFGGYRFLHVPMHEVTDRVTDATCILGNSVLHLRDRIASATAPDERFALFEDYLLRRMVEPLRMETSIAHTVERLSREQFEGRVGNLADDLAMGPKHLRRVFRDHVGLSPKSIFRISRFQRVLTHLESETNPDWATLAARFGFYDQAHLIKEFQAFTDSPPSEYMNRRGPYLNYLTVP